MKQSNIARSAVPRPKLGTQLTSPTQPRSPPGPPGTAPSGRSPTSPKIANGTGPGSHPVPPHPTLVDLHHNSIRVERGPVLESPKGSRTPIGSKSPPCLKSPSTGSPRTLVNSEGKGRSHGKSPRSPSHRPKQNGGPDTILSSSAPCERSDLMREDSTDDKAPGSFDSFVMTGDMIIRTTPKKAGSLERGVSPQMMQGDYASSSPSTSNSTPEKYDENSNQHCYNGPAPHEDNTKPRSCMVTSKSAEKVQFAPMSKNLISYYSVSKSQENYLENAENYVVDIDIDEKIATSFDALMLEQSNTSIDRLFSESKRERSEFFRLEGTRVTEESSTDVCPNCRSEVYDSVCQCVDDSRPPPLPAERSSRAHGQVHQDFMRPTYPILQQTDTRYGEDEYHYPPRPQGERLYPHEREVDDDKSETGSIYHQPTKDIDRPSAIRLAKRLYNLEGFRKSDVSRHLSKKNDFSQLVGEEYLKYFDFTGDSLDKALRKFLTRFSLTGETQERERILNHFSHRYMECNPNTYNSDDACHTLTCAIMLLNTDLHGQNIGRKMTSGEFVENLSELNDGDDFPADILRQLYANIKTEPLVWALDAEEEQNGHCPSAFLNDNGMISAQNPFLMVPDPNKTTEYISGYVMRKCCIDQDGRKTPMGKRSWKMFYATLKDMILYLHKDQNSFHKSSVYHMNNAIRIHHAMAVQALDYTKKHHVFRLKTADWAEYLFQTSDSKELQRWMDTINYVAASLSAPPLPGAVGSQRKFQRPLMPSSYTRLNLQQQLLQHESHLDELERDLKEHRTFPPEKGAKPRLIQDYLEKEGYLEYELKRFSLYVYLLQARLQAFPPAPDLEPSLVETVIGELDESSSSPVFSRTKGIPDPPTTGIPVTPGEEQVQRRPPNDKHARHVQRSLSDRYSYRAAIFRPEDSPSELLDLLAEIGGMVRRHSLENIPWRADNTEEPTDLKTDPPELDEASPKIIEKSSLENENNPGLVMSQDDTSENVEKPETANNEPEVFKLPLSEKTPSNIIETKFHSPKTGLKAEKAKDSEPFYPKGISEKFKSAKSVTAVEISEKDFGVTSETSETKIVETPSKSDKTDLKSGKSEKKAKKAKSEIVQTKKEKSKETNEIKLLKTESKSEEKELPSVENIVSKVFQSKRWTIEKLDQTKLIVIPLKSTKVDEPVSLPAISQNAVSSKTVAANENKTNEDPKFMENVEVGTQITEELLPNEGELTSSLKRGKKKKGAKLWFRRTVIEIPDTAEPEVTDGTVMEPGGIGQFAEQSTDEVVADKKLSEDTADDELGRNEQSLLELKGKKKQNWFRRFASRTPEPRRSEMDLDGDWESPHLTRSLPDGTFFVEDRKGSISSAKSSASSGTFVSSTNPDCEEDENSAKGATGTDSLETKEPTDLESDPSVLKVTNVTLGPLVLHFGIKNPAEKPSTDDNKITSFSDLANRFSNVDLPELDIGEKSESRKTRSLKRWFKRKRSQSFKYEVEKEQADVPPTPDSDSGENPWKKAKKGSSSWFHSKESTV